MWRCRYRYGSVPEMDLPARVRGFVTNVLGEADALETITEVRSRHARPATMRRCDTAALTA